MALSSIHVTVDNCVYMSAPSSPNNGVHRQKVCFYSAPNSPTESNFQSPAQPLKSLDEDSNSNSGFDDFDFDASRKSTAVEEEAAEAEFGGDTADHQSFVKAWTGYRQRPRGESMPAISFADEHFAEGKMIQVKPPPCLHSISSGSPASPRSDPRSPTSVFKFPFMMRQNLWNDDFDPFMEALKNSVQEEKEKKTHRRTRSMLPLRSYYSWKKSEPETQIQQSGPQSEPANPDQKINPSKEETQSPWKKLSEPRGVLYCRRARLVKVGQEIKTGGGGSKRHSKIKKFILKIIYESSKQKGQIGTSSSKKMNKKFSVKLTEIKEEDEHDMTKMALTRYRQPKLSLCMGGYAGMKYVK